MLEPFPFETDRLALRPFEPEDVPALQAMLNHPGLAGQRYTPWGFPEEIPLSRKQAEGIYNRWCEQEKSLHLAILLRESQELLGHAICEWDWDPHCPYVAVVIAPPHQRQGYGSDALQQLLRYLFENTPAHNVSGWVADWNQAAQQLALKQGFQESGRSRREGIRHGAYFDEIQFDILRSEWQAHLGGGRHVVGR